MAADIGDALICCVESSVESWVMDSGASFHASFLRRVMKNFRHYRGKVRLVDNKVLDITGIGDVVLTTSLGAKWTLKNVRYIPTLKRMLISVGQLDDEGSRVEFGNQQWKVSKGSMVVARGKKRGSLYMVEVSADEINTADGASSTVEETKTSTLWHRRLGHMSEKGMKMLAADGRISKLKSVTTEFCESCVLGKQKRVTFAKVGRPPKAEKLELVHSDVYGPTSVSSLAGSRYYVTFIDDATRKVWVYFLKNKSEVFATFNT